MVFELFNIDRQEPIGLFQALMSNFWGPLKQFGHEFKIIVNRAKPSETFFALMTLKEEKILTVLFYVIVTCVVLSILLHCVILHLQCNIYFIKL